MVFFCNVTLQNHVIEVFFDFMVWSPSRQVTNLPSLVAIGTAVIEI